MKLREDDARHVQETTTSASLANENEKGSRLVPLHPRIKEKLRRKTTTLHCQRVFEMTLRRLTTQVAARAKESTIPPYQETQQRRRTKS